MDDIINCTDDNTQFYLNSYITRYEGSVKYSKEVPPVRAIKAAFIDLC